MPPPPHDGNLAACARYKNDLENNLSNLIIKTEVYTIEELMQLADNYKKQIYNKNGRIILSLTQLVSSAINTVARRDVIGFSGIKIRMSDLDKVMRFDWRRGAIEVDSDTPFDIETDSANLAYIFKFEWGLSTLLVNGRLQQGTSDGVWKLARVFSLGLINSVGKSFLSHTRQRILGKTVVPIHDTEPSYLQK
jgi:hypothetical protein